ncbi:MAG: trypsin-like peptidase domain-containing protein, partial [Vicinamibacterales bacterium]
MSATGTHVLVVDDEAGFRELMRRYLEGAGYEVRTATNAHEAVRSIRESPPAVAVCDVHMPGPTGLWLAQQIREVSPATAMVLATSDAAVPPAESMRRGVVAYILKPYQREQAIGAVAQAFRWWSEQGGGELPRLEPQAGPSSAPPIERAPAPAPPRRVTPQRSGIALQPTTLVIAAVVLALLLAAAYFLGQRADGNALGRVAAASGVVMVFDGAGTRMAQGSGFFVAPDLFVTNRHVVSGGVAARILGAEERMYSVAGLVGVDAARDLAVLKTASASAATLPLSAVTPAIGDEISVYGAPLGLDGTLTTGIVSADRSDESGLLQITAPLSPGSSGSPVFTSDGAVVGVAVSANQNGEGLSFAIPAGFVADLLARAGGTQPLLVAARGAGDDRERFELIGPVRSATLTVDGATARLIFDRQGRLVERAGDEVTIQYAYDEQGRVATETHVSGEEVLATVAYRADGPATVVAEAPGGAIRRLTYDTRHRLVSEEQLVRGVLLQSKQWRHGGRPWPGAPEGHDVDALGNP